MKPSEYIVLRLLGAGQYHEVGGANAANDIAAIKKVTEQEGEYVAVPLRSFRKRTLSVESKPIVKVA